VLPNTVTAGTETIGLAAIKLVGPPSRLDVISTLSKAFE
jgi:hypothetical protein